MGVAAVAVAVAVAVDWADGLNDTSHRAGFSGEVVRGDGDKPHCRVRGLLGGGVICRHRPDITDALPKE